MFVGTWALRHYDISVSGTLVPWRPGAKAPIGFMQPQTLPVHSKEANALAT